MLHEYRREYLGEWPKPTPWEEIADYCWLLYCWKTERYDRAVCQPPQEIRYGGVMPRLPEERSLCSSFAKRVKKEVEHLALRLAGALELDRPVSQEEWSSAEKVAQKIPYEELEELLARHPLGERIAALRP